MKKTDVYKKNTVFLCGDGGNSTIVLISIFFVKT